MTTFTLQRLISNAKSTSGQMFDPHMVKMAVTVEDAHHDIKIPGQTRIPAGTYKLIHKPIGASHFDAAYSRIFGDKHKGMIQLEGVPGFDGVLIHCGNTDLDTEGCILVGAHIDIGPEGYQISPGTSRPTYIDLVYPMILAAIAAGDTFIRVVDEGKK